MFQIFIYEENGVRGCNCPLGFLEFATEKPWK